MKIYLPWTLSINYQNKKWKGTYFTSLEKKKKMNISYHLGKVLTKCFKALFGNLLNLLYLPYKLVAEQETAGKEKNNSFNLEMQWHDHCLMALWEGNSVVTS